MPQMSGSEEVLWNRTRNGYLIVANASPEKGWFQIDAAGRRLWNVERKRFEPKRSTKQPLEEEAVRLYRLVAGEDPVLDVEGQIYLDRIKAQEHSALISGFFGRRTLVRLLQRPVGLTWNGQSHPCRVVAKKGHFEAHLQLEEPAEGTWALDCPGKEIGS